MNTIPRIQLIEMLCFRKNYLEKKIPVVIQNFLRGHSISQLDTLHSALQKIGDIPVKMIQNYMDINLQAYQNFLNKEQVLQALPEQREGVFRDYFELIKNTPNDNWIVTENSPPADFLYGVDLSAIGVDRIQSGYCDYTNLSESNLAYSLIFIGGKGNASDLHTDWDGQEVILYQVFGRKRVVLFPPIAAESLLSVDVFSMIKLRGMEDAIRSKLLSDLGGYEYVLEPGDAIYIPPFYWHHLEYLDDAMSISFRFNEPKDVDLRFLIHHLHRDIFTQNLLSSLIYKDSCNLFRDVIKDIRSVFDLKFDTPLLKYKAMQKICRSAYEKICLDGTSYKPSTWITFNDFFDSILCRRYEI
jgi:hypothetical protein